ncbi:hypothetical protein PPYR_03722 [Photinus pyralis]|uniref:Uncharacterized protein n=1 Tax=Photinus pyralis TaxID=7054 RepID=A0A1Y1KU55_PHOPY|nr:uncharacterized protein LOC116161297 [Photinus pyralis]KAB0791922.1 hypothetical protein PPYR_03722 [Photinus pyralis]
MMKSLFIIVFLFSGGVWAKRLPMEIYDIWYKISEPYDTECALVAEVAKEYVKEQLLKGSIPDNVRFKSYLVCIYERLELFGNDGNFNKHKVHNVIPYMSVPLTEVCATEAMKGRDRLEKSYLMGYCAVDGLSVDD